MSVIIQCPNARRHTVKVNPNTSILEVLENVCEKQGFDPNEYDLFRNNKPIDLSLTIRFANIPNNGQLELKKSSVVRKDQKVLIAIDLEDGKRQISEFDSNQNLWEIIQIMFKNNPILILEQNMEFSVVYVQKEITGETALKETHLKSLGLVQGRAAMKLLVRPINSKREQAYVEALDLKKFAEKSESNKEKQTTPHKSEIKQKLTDSDPNTEQNVNKTIDAKETVVISEQPNKEKAIEVTENKWKDIQPMEISSVESSDDSEEVLCYLGGNNSEILFKMSDLPKVSNKEFPDHFYETTKDDIMFVLSDLRRQQENSQKQLETKQMRELKRKEQINKYNKTVIRICFPNDKLIFQAIFKPTDSIEDVKRVVTPYISSVDFHLYTVPPKLILSSESILSELGLVPAAVLHFGLNSSDNHQKVIKNEFVSKVSSYRSAAKIATEARNGPKSTVSNTNEDNSQTMIGNRSANQNPSSGQNKTKLPKWFKTNK